MNFMAPVERPEYHFLSCGPEGKGILNKRGDYGNCLLHLAIINAQSDLVKLILPAGADPNVRNYKGETGLHLALKHGRSEVVGALLQAGANPNERNKKGENALFSGVKAKRLEAVETLISEAEKHNVSIDVNQCNNNGENSLFQAAVNEDPEMVNYLSQLDVELDKPNNDGDTAAHAAAFNGCTESLRELISHGASMNKLNKEERTPISVACQRALRGDVAPLVALLEALLEMKKEGAEIDVTAGSHAEGDNGWNPLMFSVKTQCLKAVNLSLEFVDVNAKAAGGECALSIAAESGNKKLFARLTEAGAHDHKRKYEAQLRRRG